MRWLIFFLCLFVFASFAYGLESDYETLITTGEEIRLAQGRIYFDYPDSILEDEVFSIELLFYPNIAEGVFTLYREGFPLLPVSSGSELGEEQSYFHLSWADALQNNATYVLTYTSANQLLYEKKFSIEVIPKPIASQTKHEEILTLESVSEELLATTRTLLNERRTLSLSADEIKNFHENAQKKTTLTKSKFYQETIFEDATVRNETIVVLTITPQEPLQQLTIIEHIPKTFASRARYLRTNQPVDVLVDDPVIMWHLEDVSTPVELTYSIDKTTEVTGNTVLLSPTSTSSQRYINWKLIGPLLIIPLIALFIIYFEKFSPKKN